MFSLTDGDRMDAEIDNIRYDQARVRRAELAKYCRENGLDFSLYQHTVPFPPF